VTTKNDPEKYRRLSAPRSADETNAALEAFFKDLGDLREKHGLPDVITVVGVNVQYDSGVGNAVSWSQYGAAQKAETLLAYAFGQAQAERRELVNRLTSGKKLSE
jgi:hypothetical protein